MNNLPKDDLELHQALGVIMLSKELSPVVKDIAQHIYDYDFDRKVLQEVLTNHDIDKVEDLKEDLLDLIIDYVEIILNDHAVSDIERKNVGLLKIFFKISEGDFYTLKFNEIASICHKQFERIYEDGIVTKEEDMHKFEIQDLFDLSYDQFEELKENDPIIKEAYMLFN